MNQLLIESAAAQILVDGTYTRVLNEPSPSHRSAADAPPNSDKFRRTLHRISVRLSQKADKLPETIYVRGVKIMDRFNLNGGAFADIYKGIYKGEEVAVKKLRVTLYQSPDQRTKTVKVSDFMELRFKLLTTSGRHCAARQQFGYTSNILTFSRSWALIARLLAGRRVCCPPGCHMGIYMTTLLRTALWRMKSTDWSVELVISTPRCCDSSPLNASCARSPVGSHTSTVRTLFMVIFEV